MTQKYLTQLKKDDKFIHNNEIYTVYEHSGNMTEVFKNGRFWAWNNWTGKDGVKVTPFNL